MDTKRTIRRIFIAVVSLAICSGLLVLLVAAIGKKNRGLCRDYLINIKGEQDNFFIDQKDVTGILTGALKGQIRGQAISSFHLRKLEQLLESNTWVRDAELWFDSQDVLHVTVDEREPIARVFTSGGYSFYIDSSCKQLPLSEKLSPRLPVFTGFTDRKYLGPRDSVLLSGIRNTALFITRDPFWMSQVQQIDITHDRKFEMIPMIGNHVVKLGTAEDIEKKFRRLFVFYKQVMGKTGFEKYVVVDVQYRGQVVGIKNKK